MSTKLSEMDLTGMEVGLQYALEYLEATMSFKFSMDAAENYSDFVEAADKLYKDILRIEHKSENTPS